MTYEYRFESIDVHRQPRQYRDKIAEFAEQGWRLVQVLVETPAVMPSEYVLILERGVDVE